MLTRPIDSWRGSIYIWWYSHQSVLLPRQDSLSHPAKNRLRSRLRRFVILATIAALTACTLGIPLPRQVENRVSEPYPCMNCPCGCKTAEVCWRNCCCHTPAEKLAWARENGVTPPAYVLAATQGTPVEKKPCCCSKKATVVSCCSSQAKPKCCGSDSTGCKSQPQCSQVRHASTSTMLIIQALRCQGLTSSLTALPPTVLPHSIVPDFLLPSAGEALLIDDAHTLGPFSAPDTPPPQRLA